MTRSGIWLLCLILLTGCNSEQPQSAVVATDRCDEPDMPALQGGDHLIGDQPPPVPYNSVPPTSGWHSSGAFDIAVQPRDQPLTAPEQVSALEAGAAVVTYRDLPAADLDSLEGHVRQRYGGRVAVSAYDELDQGAVAFTAWGVRQFCDGVDLAALDAFVTAYADEQPAVPGER